MNNIGSAAGYAEVAPTKETGYMFDELNNRTQYLLEKITSIEQRLTRVQQNIFGEMPSNNKALEAAKDSSIVIPPFTLNSILCDTIIAAFTRIENVLEDLERL